jgi:hypothetical protein
MLPSAHDYRLKKISMNERLEEAIEEIGGESLRGSGFEHENGRKGDQLDRTCCSRAQQASVSVGDPVWLALPYKSLAVEIVAFLRRIRHFSLCTLSVRTNSRPNRRANSNRR